MWKDVGSTSGQFKLQLQRVSAQLRRRAFNALVRGREEEERKERGV